MELISSDTNIWVDFNSVGFLHIPFSLCNVYQYIISKDTFEQELLYPPELSIQLKALGLRTVEVNPYETVLSLGYMKYKALSPFDRLALAIAQNRGIILLTGDGNLRKAAIAEHVAVHGSLWIVDEAYKYRNITQDTHRSILEALLSNPKTRLPEAEITKRLEKLS